MVTELTANHSAYYIDDSDRARARRCWPTAGTTTCSRSTSRSATTTRSARSTRTRRSRCSTSTSATARARARSPPPTGAALTAAENAWLDYYVKGVGSEPADARGGVDILTSKCPVNSAGTRYHAPSWAQLAPGEIRDRRRRGADDRRARHRRRRTRSRPATSARRPSSADNAVGRDLQGPGGDERLHARGLADDHRQARRQGRQRHGRGAAVRRRRRHAAADRARRVSARSASAPARRSRSSSCTRRPGPSSPATCSSSSCWRRTRRTCARRPASSRSRSATCSCGCRSSTRPARDLGGRDRGRRPAAKYFPPGYKLAREYATEAHRRRRRHRAGHAVADAGRAGVASARSRRASTREYTASTTATVISTAGDAALTVVRSRPPDERHVRAPAAAARRARARRRGPGRCPTRRRRSRSSQRIGAADAAAHRHLRQDADLHSVDDESVELVAEGGGGPAPFALVGTSRPLAPSMPLLATCPDFSTARVGAWAVLVSAEAPAASEPVSATAAVTASSGGTDPPRPLPLRAPARRAPPRSGSRHRRTGSVPCRDRTADRAFSHVRMRTSLSRR